MERSTKLILSYATFAMSNIWLGTGFIQEGTWMTVVMAIVAIYSTARVIDKYGERNGCWLWTS